MSEENNNDNNEPAPVHVVGAPSSDSITISKDKLWKYSTFVLLALVVVMAFVSFGNDGSPTTGAAIGAPSGGTGGALAVVSASVDDDAAWGNPDLAKVTIVEFSDFQCPFCSRAAPTVKQIKAEYGDDVLFVYRDLPLSQLHPLAQKSAEAAECLRAQGGDDAFWTYHDVIFANQGALSIDNLNTWASDLGYDISFCLDSGEFADEVLKDSQDASAAGCTGTPCFIVMNSEGEGQKVNGAQPFSAFKPIIDAYIAAA